MNAGDLTVGRTTWWVERGLLVLAAVLAATLYTVAVTKAELGLPLDVQVALFESQHGILWVDSQTVPAAATAQQHR